jgi:hypothetical protein
VSCFLNPGIKLKLKLTLMSEKKLTTALWIFPAILVATLLQSYYDIAKIFTGSELAIYTYEGPIAYKIGKNLIYLLVFFSVVLYSKKTHKSILNYYSISIIFFCCISLYYFCFI